MVKVEIRGVTVKMDFAWRNSQTRKWPLTVKIFLLDGGNTFLLTDRIFTIAVAQLIVDSIRENHTDNFSNNVRQQNRECVI